MRLTEREERRQREVREESAQGLGRAFGAFGRKGVERLLVRVGRVQQRDAAMIQAERGRARRVAVRLARRARSSAREGTGTHRLR